MVSVSIFAQNHHMLVLLVTDTANTSYYISEYSMSTFGYSMSTHCPALSAPMYSTNSTLWSPQAAWSIWVRVEWVFDKNTCIGTLGGRSMWLPIIWLPYIIGEPEVDSCCEWAIHSDEILGVDNLFSENDIKTKKQNHTDTPLLRTCPLGQKIHPFWDFGPSAVTRRSLSEDSGYNRAPWHSSR